MPTRSSRRRSNCHRAAPIWLPEPRKGLPTAGLPPACHGFLEMYNILCHKKNLRRHRGKVAATTVYCLALVGLGIVASAQCSSEPLVVR